MRKLWVAAAVTTLLVASGVSAATAQDAAGEQTVQASGQGQQSATDYLLGAIAPLGHDRFQSLMQHVGVDPGAQRETFGCLCSKGFAFGVPGGYQPEPSGDCRNTLPCKGGNWGCVSFDLPASPTILNGCLGPKQREALIGAVEAVSATLPPPDSRYKKLCDAALAAFPLVAPQVAREGTGMLWDDGMISDSLLAAIAAYRKDHPPGQPDNEVATNDTMGSAEGYGLWLFGHGQDFLGGPQCEKSEAAQAVRLDDVRKILKKTRDDLQEAIDRYHHKYEYNAPTNEDIQKYLTFVSELRNRISRLEVEERALGRFRKSIRPGTEMALLDAIKAAKSAKPEGEKLTPGDVFHLALKQTGGKINQALLLAHNTLRALARPGLGDYPVTGVQEKPEFFNETFVTLREGDNSGPFYHIFGTAFFAYQQRVTNAVMPQVIGSELANQLEQWFRELNPNDPQPPDPVKYCFNYWGAQSGSRLFDLTQPRPSPEEEQRKQAIEESNRTRLPTDPANPTDLINPPVVAPMK